MKNVDKLYNKLSKLFYYFHKAIEDQEFKKAADTRDEIKKILKEIK